MTIIRSLSSTAPLSGETSAENRRVPSLLFKWGNCSLCFSCIGIMFSLQKAAGGSTAFLLRRRGCVQEESDPSTLSCGRELLTPKGGPLFCCSLTFLHAGRNFLDTGSLRRTMCQLTWNRQPSFFSENPRTQMQTVLPVSIMVLLQMVPSDVNVETESG